MSSSDHPLFDAWLAGWLDAWFKLPIEVRRKKTVSFLNQVSPSLMALGLFLLAKEIDRRVKSLSQRTKQNISGMD